MQRYYDMSKLLQALLKQPYPTEIIKDMLFSMFTIEQVKLNGENQSCMIIAENSADIKYAEQECGLQDRIAETDEIISTDGGRLRKRIFVLDDTGNGVVFYSHTGNEKHTK